MRKRLGYVVILLCSALFFLSGCGGGGGGGGGRVASTPPPPPVAPPSPTKFTQWSAVTLGETVEFDDGISQDATFTAPGPAVTGIDDQGVSSSSSATIKYQDDGSIERISIDTPSTSVTWDAVTGDIIDDIGIAVLLSDQGKENVGVLVNPLHADLDWEYQTYGIWATGCGTGSGTIGGITVGTPTTGSAIPKDGNATFVGISSGIYVDAAGTGDYLTTSDVRVDVDFFNRQLDLTTSNTMKSDSLNPFSGVSSPADNLNMTGTLIYDSEVNSFASLPDGVSTTSGLVGTSDGRFYGPNAEELGGVFSLFGAGVESYIGAYGAKQVP